MIILSSNGLKINNESVDFNIIQPSSPITKNKKTGETLDLGAHPNAQIECELSNALVVTKTYACEFEYDGHQYNFDAKVINQVHTSNNKYNVSLQAVGKVIVGGKSTAPTISYDNTTFTVSASGDGEVKMYVDGVETVSPHTFDAVGTYVVTATAEQDGKAISDTVTENITIAKTATPTISYDNTTFTVSASGNGTVKMYVDGVETVSPHTFNAVGTYVVTATAIETGKFLSDTATENITIAKTATPTISYDDSTYTVSASGNGTVTMYVDGTQETSPYQFTQGQSDVTYTVTATAIETGKFLSDTATENCLVPAASQPGPVIPTCDNTITLDNTNSFGGNGGEDTNGVIMGCKTSEISQPGWNASTMRWIGQSEGSSPNIKYNFCPIAYDCNSELNIRKITFSASGSESWGYDTAAECEGRLEAVDLSSYYEDEPNLEYLHVYIDELTPYQLSNGKYVPQYEITIYVDDNGDADVWDMVANALRALWENNTPVFLLSYNRGDGNATGNWLYLGDLANDGESDYYDNQQIYVGYVVRPLYILGNVNGQSWGPNIGTEINFDSSQFMYTLTITAPANEAGSFSFSTQLASQGGNDGWAELFGFMYGAHDENHQVEEGHDSQVLEPGTHYFEIQAGTEYNISIDSGIHQIEFEQVMPEEPGE